MLTATATVRQGRLNRNPSVFCRDSRRRRRHLHVYTGRLIVLLYWRSAQTNKMTSRQTQAPDKLMTKMTLRQTEAPDQPIDRDKLMTKITRQKEAPDQPINRDKLMTKMTLRQTEAPDQPINITSHQKETLKQPISPHMLLVVSAGQMIATGIAYYYSATFSKYCCFIKVPTFTNTMFVESHFIFILIYLNGIIMGRPLSMNPEYVNQTELECLLFVYLGI